MDTVAPLVALIVLNPICDAAAFQCILEVPFNKISLILLVSRNLLSVVASLPYGIWKTTASGLAILG